MNIIAIMGPHGVFYKDEPIKELERALLQQGFQIIWPQNSVDLLKFIEHNREFAASFLTGMSTAWSCVAISTSLTNTCRFTPLSIPIRRWMSAHTTCAWRCGFSSML